MHVEEKSKQRKNIFSDKVWNSCFNLSTTVSIFPTVVLDRVWEYSSHSENWLPQKTSKEGRDCKQLYLRFLSRTENKQKIGKPALISFYWNSSPSCFFQSQSWGDFFTVMPMLSHGYTTVVEQNCFKTQSMKFLFPTKACEGKYLKSLSVKVSL